MKRKDELLEKDVEKLASTLSTADEQQTKQASMLIKMFPLFEELYKQKEKDNVQ